MQANDGHMGDQMTAIGFQLSVHFVVVITMLQHWVGICNAYLIALIAFSLSVDHLMRHNGRIVCFPEVAAS